MIYTLIILINNTVLGKDENKLTYKQVEHMSVSDKLETNFSTTITSFQKTILLTELLQQKFFLERAKGTRNMV